MKEQANTVKNVDRGTRKFHGGMQWFLGKEVGKAKVSSCLSISNLRHNANPLLRLPLIPHLLRNLTCISRLRSRAFL